MSLEKEERVIPKEGGKPSVSLPLLTPEMNVRQPQTARADSLKNAKKEHRSAPFENLSYQEALRTPGI